MSLRGILLVVFGAQGLLLLAWSHAAFGQAAAPAARAAPVSDNAGPATEAEQKDKILASDCWRRAMFELNEWFRTQSIYTPEEVARLKADFSARVDRMSAAELQLVLEDLDAKFRILETPQAKEVRAWLGNYLSILSDRGRADLLRLIPDFETMNSARLQETIARLAARRDARGRQNTQVQQLRSSATNPWAQNNPPSARPASRSAYRSPYRPPSTQRPFDDVDVGRRRGGMVDPYGRIWIGF